MLILPSDRSVHEGMRGGEWRWWFGCNGRSCLPVMLELQLECKCWNVNAGMCNRASRIRQSRPLFRTLLEDCSSSDRYSHIVFVQRRYVGKRAHVGREKDEVGLYIGFTIHNPYPRYPRQHKDGRQFRITNRSTYRESQGVSKRQSQWTVLSRLLAKGFPVLCTMWPSVLLVISNIVFHEYSQGEACKLAFTEILEFSVGLALVVVVLHIIQAGEATLRTEIEALVPWLIHCRAGKVA